MIGQLPHGVTVVAPATSQAKSFQLQPLPAGRLSHSSFDAPRLTENIRPYGATIATVSLMLCILVARSREHGGSNKMLRFILPAPLVICHMCATGQTEGARQY
jgi:hypothetical protein